MERPEQDDRLPGHKEVSQGTQPQGREASRPGQAFPGRKREEFISQLHLISISLGQSGSHGGVTLPHSGGISWHLRVTDREAQGHALTAGGQGGDVERQLLTRCGAWSIAPVPGPG